MWRKLNMIIGRGTEPITRIVKDNLEISGEQLADAFNDSFLRNIPLSSGSDSFPYMQPRCEHTMFLWPTSESEIIATYTSLKNSTATDNTELQMKPVKFVIDLIAPCLTHIINSCISCAVFPRRMQCAKVTAIYKKGDKNVLGNYRPISILPVFSKGFEQIISARLISFTDRYSTLTDSQYGF